jgi:hypothetical protein
VTSQALTINNAEWTYLIHGENPRLLIDTGVHGDEYETIDLVSEYLQDNLSKMPDFIYIPVVSPTAVALKTRNNHLDLDVNRHFYDSSIDEVTAYEEIIKNYNFDLCVTWHEDDTKDGFYCYDSGDMEGSQVLEKLRSSITSLGVPLFTGIDWEGDVKFEIDPTMGAVIKNGYIGNEKRTDSNGQFFTWSTGAKYIKRILNPEIPGKLDLSTKKKLINLFFDQIVLQLAV